MISFIILNYKSFDDTIECIHSIQKIKTNKKISIIVVDNNSLDSVQEKEIKKYTKDLVLLTENVGFYWFVLRYYTNIISAFFFDCCAANNSVVFDFPCLEKRIIRVCCCYDIFVFVFSLHIVFLQHYSSDFFGNSLCHLLSLRFCRFGPNLEELETIVVTTFFLVASALVKPCEFRVTMQHLTVHGIDECSGIFIPKRTFLIELNSPSMATIRFVDDNR